MICQFLGDAPKTYLSKLKRDSAQGIGPDELNVDSGVYRHRTSGKQTGDVSASTAESGTVTFNIMLNIQGLMGI
jgi:hypothetical protein